MLNRASFGFLSEVAAVVDRQQLDRALALIVAPDALGHLRQHPLLDLGVARQRVGRRHLGHRHLMVEAGLVVVERHRHREDRLAVLDRDHAPRREALAVADPVDVVDDRHLRIAAEQEIRVQRMRLPAFDGAACGDQRLGDDLAAEHALQSDLRAAPAKQVDLERFEIEQREQFLDGVRFRRGRHDAVTRPAAMKSSALRATEHDYILAQTILASIVLLFMSGPHLAPFSVVVSGLRA